MNSRQGRRTATKARGHRSGSYRKSKTNKLHPIHHLHFGLCIALCLQILALALLGLRGETVVHAGPPSAPANKVWNQIWNDEFNGSSIDSSKWNVENNSNYGASNKEDECYRTDNVSVGGGSLKLTAKRETVTCGGTNPDTGNGTYYFTSGLVTTRAQGGSMKFKFRQGYAEARVKAPKGNPYWPAFWLVSPNDGSTPGWPDYGEFDIFELYGARPDVTNGALHYKCTDADAHCQTNPTWYNLVTDNAYGGQSNLGTQITNQSQLNAYSGGTTDYHTYGFLWEGDKISWYVDGRKYRFFDGTNVYRIEQNGSQTLETTTATLGQPAIPFSTVFNYEHSIILNLAVGGNGPRYSAYGYTGLDTAGGYQDGNYAADNPASLDVDYVRVYQLGDAPVNEPDPTPPVSDPTPTTSPTTETKQETTKTTSPPASTSVTNTATGEKVTIAENNTSISGQAVLDPSIATDKEVQDKIAKVEYYANGKLVQTVTKPPFQLDTKKLPNGTYKIEEKVHFKDGSFKLTSAKVTINNTAAQKAKENEWKSIVAVILSGILLVVVLITYIVATPRWHSRAVNLLRRLHLTK